jgi:hypothetical protein
MSDRYNYKIASYNAENLKSYKRSINISQTEDSIKIQVLYRDHHVLQHYFFQTGKVELVISYYLPLPKYIADRWDSSALENYAVYKGDLDLNVRIGNMLYIEYLTERNNNLYEANEIFQICKQIKVQINDFKNDFRASAKELFRINPKLRVRFTDIKPSYGSFRYRGLPF